MSEKYKKSTLDYILIIIVTFGILFMVYGMVTFYQVSKDRIFYPNSKEYFKDSINTEKKVEILSKAYQKGYTQGSLNTIKYAGKKGSVKKYRETRIYDSINFRKDLYEQTREKQR